MPCKDITEVIQLDLDHNDRIASYRLNKRTCGARIGEESLLLPWVGGQHVQDILRLQASVMLDAVDAAEAEEFLYVKHLVALQEALRVVMGEEDGGPDTLCTTCSVQGSADGLRFEGLISVDAVTSKIKACGNCGGCGSKRNKKTG